MYLIGAGYDDSITNNSGLAYLFSTDGALLVTFPNPTPAHNDVFGCSVAAMGNSQVLIGAYGDDTGAGLAGAAYIFNAETYTPGLVADSVRAGSITTYRLTDGAVDSTKLAISSVGTEQIAGGAVGSAQIADGSVSGTDIEDGTLTVTDVVANEFWTASGNAGTAPGSHFLGTTDNQPLELKVNNQRGFRMEYATNASYQTVNLLGGYSGNSIGSGTVGATIGGGGTSREPEHDWSGRGLQYHRWWAET